jgi:hypothetical protein
VSRRRTTIRPPARRRARLAGHITPSTLGVSSSRPSSLRDEVYWITATMAKRRLFALGAVARRTEAPDGLRRSAANNLKVGGGFQIAGFCYGDHSHAKGSREWHLIRR